MGPRPASRSARARTHARHPTPTHLRSSPVQRAAVVLWGPRPASRSARARTRARHPTPTHLRSSPVQRAAVARDGAAGAGRQGSRSPAAAHLAAVPGHQPRRRPPGRGWVLGKAAPARAFSGGAMLSGEAAWGAVWHGVVWQAPVAQPRPSVPVLRACAHPTLPPQGPGCSPTQPWLHHHLCDPFSVRQRGVRYPLLAHQHHPRTNPHPSCAQATRRAASGCTAWPRSRSSPPRRRTRGRC